MFKYKYKNVSTQEILAPTHFDADGSLTHPLAHLIGKGALRDLHEDIPEHEDEDGNLIPFEPKNYELVVEDITTELASKAAAEQARKDASARLKARPGNAPVTPADFDDLLEALGLKG